MKENEVTPRGRRAADRGAASKDVTALGRRGTDKVSSSKAFELVATLATEYALQNPNVDRDALEAAIVQVRGQLKGQ